MMQLPNKLYSYKNSTLALIPMVLDALDGSPMSIKKLYLKVRPMISDPTDFMSVMDCLYTLQAVDINDNDEVFKCL